LLPSCLGVICITQDENQVSYRCRYMISAVCQHFPIQTSNNFRKLSGVWARTEQELSAMLFQGMTSCRTTTRFSRLHASRVTRCHALPTPRCTWPGRTAGRPQQPLTLPTLTSTSLTFRSTSRRDSSATRARAPPASGGTSSITLARVRILKTICAALIYHLFHSFYQTWSWKTASTARPTCSHDICLFVPMSWRWLLDFDRCVMLQKHTK